MKAPSSTYATDPSGTKYTRTPPPTGPRLNVFQMIDLAEANVEDSDRYPIFLRRHTWDTPNVFAVVGTYPDWKDYQDWGTPPYYSRRNPRTGKWEGPLVYGVVHWARTRDYEAHILSCPGTYKYDRISRPAWFCPPDNRTTLELPDGIIADFSLRSCL